MKYIIILILMINILFITGCASMLKDYYNPDIKVGPPISYENMTPQEKELFNALMSSKKRNQPI